MVCEDALGGASLTAVRACCEGPVGGGEALSELLEAREFPIELVEALGQERLEVVADVGAGAGLHRVQVRGDVVEGKVELFAGLDEVEAGEDVVVVLAVPVAGAAGSDEANRFVVAQRCGWDAAPFADFRDPHEAEGRPAARLTFHRLECLRFDCASDPSDVAVLTQVVTWGERHQIGLYLLTILAAAVFGLLLPGAHALEAAIEPVLGLLLYATFLGVPFAAIGAGLRDRRFPAAVFGVNFLLVPAVVFGLSRLVAGESALLFGVLLVLLTPCIDYVIVFTGLAGGDSAKLLGAAPLLMLTQILLLPVYLYLFIGPTGLAVVQVGPFARAFLLLIVLPLIAAAVTQALARRTRFGVRLQLVTLGAMVPLMMATLFAVVASQAAVVAAAGSRLLVLVPIYAGFLIVMALLGTATGKALRLDVPARRAVVFSGATRNSLVVLPLALALPASLALAPAVVVTQTLVELVGMVIYVRLVPKLIPAPPTASSRRAGASS